jgi:hypothetical protein
MQGSSSLTVGPLYTVRDKPNRVVKCPYHAENMREKETKSVTVKRDREQEEEEYVESMRKEDTRQHEEVGGSVA